MPGVTGQLDIANQTGETPLGRHLAGYDDGLLVESWSEGRSHRRLVRDLWPILI